MREKFFLVIQNHEAHEDLRHLLELLDTLTENGKDITNFEEKVTRIHMEVQFLNIFELSVYRLVNLCCCGYQLSQMPICSVPICK